MGLKAGSVNDFAGSMAEAMDAAFAAEWQLVMDSDLPELGHDMRRMVFSAIAQGVVKHLQQKASEAFRISVDVEQVRRDVPEEPLVVCDNPADVTVHYDGTRSFIEARDMRVEQVSPLIASEGAGIVEEVLVDGVLH